MKCDQCPISLLCLGGPISRHTATYCDVCKCVVVRRFNYDHGHNEPLSIVDRRFPCREETAQLHLTHVPCHVCRGQRRHRRHQAQRQRRLQPKEQR